MHYKTAAIWGRYLCDARRAVLAALLGWTGGCLTPAWAQDKSGDSKPGPNPTQTAPRFLALPPAAADPPLPLSLRELLPVPPYAREVRLAPLDVAALLEEDQSRADADKRLRIGVGRALDPRACVGQWNPAPGGGFLWTLAVVSEQAVGLRLHVSGATLPAGGELRLLSAADPRRPDGPYVGAGPFASGSFWSTILPGDTAYIEYRTPVEVTAAPADLPFGIDRVQHLYRDPAVLTGDEREGTCHNDVTCYSAWATVKNAVAGIAFVGESSFICTGQLLNTLAGDLTPYLLTAAHCIENEEMAQSMVVYWRYQTDTCNGTPPALPSVPTSAVAELVATSPYWAYDYSLTLLRGALPPGAYTWAGWTSVEVPDGTPCSCIHHPGGAYKRISFANTVSGAANDFMRLDWYDGPTESGSSGAGAYLDATQQLVGVLSYGPSSCADESYDDFSPFSAIYAGIANWLVDGPDDLFEDNNTCAAAATLAASTYTGLVVKYGDDDWYRVQASSCGPVDVTVNLTHAFGNIDLKLYDACGGNEIAASTGSGDSETVTLPAGESRDYWLRVYLASSVRNTYELTVATTPGGTRVYPIDAGGLPIPDNNATGLTHTYAVPNHGTLTGLKAGLRINHTWNGDVRVKLTHNGTTVTLIDRPGVPGRDAGFNNDGFDVLLDDAASAAIESYNSGGPTVVGTYRPNGLLSAFNGQDAYGLWTLNVADLAAQDTGTLESWTLYVPPLEPCECWGNGDVTGDGATDCADFAVFQRCFTGAGGGAPAPGCQGLNFDCDADIDLDDFHAFSEVLTGPSASRVETPGLPADSEAPATPHTDLPAPREAATSASYKAW
jgi:subtilisin-like proprotein convertase family protein